MANWDAIQRANRNAVLNHMDPSEDPNQTDVAPSPTPTNNQRVTASPVASAPLTPSPSPAAPQAPAAWTDAAATSAPSSYNSPAPDPHTAQLVADWIKNNNLQANQSDPNSLHSITQYLHQQGVNAQVDYTDPNGHTGGILINGQPYQLINGQNQWTPLQPWQESGGGGAGAGLQAPQATAGTPQDPQLTAAVRDQLLQIMGHSQDPITTADPNISGQSQAYRVARERGGQQERAALAERAAAEGLNSGGQGSGAFDTGVQGIQEGVGQDIASNDASLVGNEVTARRQQLMQALDLANAVGARNEAQALQLQLANLDNQFRYASLSENARQANNNLGFNYDQLSTIANRQALLDALGGGA